MSNPKIEEQFLGITAKSGCIEAYDLNIAMKYDFHHNNALSPLGTKLYDEEGTLRFVIYFGDDKYTLEGSPALDPFDKGFKQIQIFARYCIEAGSTTQIAVVDHALGTPFEGKIIGKLGDWI